MYLLQDPVTKPWVSSLQDLGPYKNNKELLTEDDFEKISLET